MKDEDNPEVFWTQREKEINGKILFRTMARIEGLKTPFEWALFYGTDKKIYFQFFKKKNLLSSVTAKGTGEDSCHEIDLSLVDKIDFMEPKKILKLFNIFEGRMNIRFREKVEIKNNYFTECCLLFPLERISKLKDSFPALHKA